MTFLVYQKATGQIVRTFKLESSAKRSATCLNKALGDVYFTHADRETYERRTANRTVVKNLMTGKDIEIDSDTPWCCNPASETYWSM